MPRLPSMIRVAGNCDFSSKLPLMRVVTLGGKKIYCTHGHTEHVKYGTDELICRARQEGADIVLYGHTHSGVTAYDDGLYIMNPGQHTRRALRHDRHSARRNNAQRSETLR